MTWPERFWSKVNKSDSCWLWTGAKEGHGYGSFAINRRTQYAHRVSWELTYGAISAGICVLHKCDTPLCVNPVHLFLGTRADNSHDMMAKGRHRRGQGSAKLTEAKVRTILAEYVPRKARQDCSPKAKKVGSMQWLAVKYGVRPSTIANILAGRLWPHITKTRELVHSGQVLP